MGKESWPTKDTSVKEGVVKTSIRRASRPSKKKSEKEPGDSDPKPEKVNDTDRDGRKIGRSKGHAPVRKRLGEGKKWSVKDGGKRNEKKPSTSP